MSTTDIDTARTETRAEYAYRQLRERIIDMRLVPGAALDEEALMAELQVGRTPMREAVKRLETDRLLVVYARRGTIIADVNIRDLRAISDARRVLESYAAAQAAQRATPADITRLTVLRERVAPGTGPGTVESGAGETSTVESMDLDELIHRSIYTVMRNSYVESTLIQYYNLSLRMWNFVLAGLPAITGNVREHDALLAAVINRDAERAGRLAAEHVTNFEDLVRRAL